VEASAVDLVDSSLDRPAVRTQNDDGSVDLLSTIDANVLVIAGTVTEALSEVVRKAYANLPEPKKVIAFGVCAITGGPYWDSYAVVPGAHNLIPVDLNVPGCPPTPEDLARAFAQVGEL
jgi:NADH-quinone oxidoreductase subunit B